LCSEINVDLQRTKLLLKYAGFLIRAALQFPLLVDHKNTQCIFTSCLNTMCYNLRKKPSPENQTDLVAIARFLCECGINPRYTYNNQQNLLTVAHLTKHTLLTDFLLKECGLDPHNRDEIIQARTDKGIAISASMYSVISPLIIASYENDDTWVELLIKSERPEHKPQIHPFRDMSGRYPPAIRAIKNKNPKMFDMLWNYTLNKNDPSRPAAIWTICAFNNPVQSTIELFPPEVLNEIKQVYVLLDQKVRKKNMKTMIDICFECDEKIWPAPIGRKNTTYISSPTRVYSLDDERVKMGPEAYGHSTLKERSNLINGWKQEVKDWLIERDRIREIVIIDTANRPLEIAAKT